MPAWHAIMFALKNLPETMKTQKGIAELGGKCMQNLHSDRTKLLKHTHPPTLSNAKTLER